jgi:hypothetical protein
MPYYKLESIVRRKLLVGLVFCFLSQASFSAELFKRNVQVMGISSQAERPAKDFLGDKDYVYTSGAWNTESSCHQDLAVMPKGNDLMRSIGLAALMSGKTVDLYVDDSLPRVAGIFCQVVVLHINMQ